MNVASVEIEVELQRFDIDSAGWAVLSGFAKIKATKRPQWLETMQAHVHSVGNNHGPIRLAQ